MTKSYACATICFLLFALVSISACSGQDKSSLSKASDVESEPVTSDTAPNGNELTNERSPLPSTEFSGPGSTPARLSFEYGNRFVCPSFAGDWNQFLGPNRDGVITTSNHIPANPKLNIVWSRDLGSGYSGILESNGYLFTMHKQGKSTVMTCMKADTGETVWQYDIAPFFPKDGSAHEGPRSTPALDKEQVACKLAAVPCDEVLSIDHAV